VAEMVVLGKDGSGEAMTARMVEMVVAMVEVMGGRRRSICSVL